MDFDDVQATDQTGLAIDAESIGNLTGGNVDRSGVSADGGPGFTDGDLGYSGAADPNAQSVGASGLIEAAGMDALAAKPAKKIVTAGNLW